MIALDILHSDRVAAVVRANRVPDPRRLCDALAAGGVRLVEFTFTIPGVLEVIQRATGGDAIIGAGTVLNRAQARAAVAAGAQFVVTPAVVVEVADECSELGVPFFLGAYTPGEMLSAHQLGSAAVKIVPAGTGGPAHIKNLRGPVPYIDLVPSGGVTPENAANFLDAGAIAVFAGSDLVSPTMVEGEQYDAVRTRAAAYAAAVRRG